jgi:protein TonB
MLRFVMDPEGRVLSYRIERSSGHRLLDEEVREMIERASPLPAMPDGMQQARLELVVPVSFFLR